MLEKYNILHFLNIVTFGVGFLVIGCVLYMTETATYAGIIYQETSEWDTYPIKEIVNIAANVNKTVLPGDECPNGYELLSYNFQGTNDLCVKPTGEYTKGKCRR